MKHGVGNGGKRIHYYFNYSGTCSSARMPTPPARPADRQDHRRGATVALGPWDLAILEKAEAPARR